MLGILSGAPRTGATNLLPRESFLRQGRGERESVDDGVFVHEVYDASYRRLVGQLVGITGSLAEAEDVVQEAFARACNHVRTFRHTDNPEAWLRRVAVNGARGRAPRVLAGMRRRQPPRGRRLHRERSAAPGRQRTGAEGRCTGAPAVTARWSVLVRHP